MNFRDLYSKIFPERALRRALAKQRLERLGKIRSLDQVAGGRSRFSFNTTTNDMDSEISDNIEDLRSQIRNYELTNGTILGGFKRIVKNVVGKGIRLNAGITADDPEDRMVPAINEKQALQANKLIEKYFKIWNKQADKRLMLNFYGSNGIQGIIEHALLRDNEVLIIGRNSNRPGRLIPYCLEVLEADRLQTPPGAIGDPYVKGGVRFDSEGVPKTYYVLKEHPGNTLNLKNTRDEDYEEIPAYNDNGTKKVMFLFNPIRPEQTRAISFAASGLKDIQDADRIMDAEKLAALEDACVIGTVTSTSPSSWTETSGKDDYDYIHEFAPNQIKYLYPGEKFEAHRPQRPHNNFEAFLQQVWSGPANAYDVPPEVFLQKWQGMNYSNARTVLLQFYATCIERQEYLIDYFCNHVYENVFRWFIVKGFIPENSFRSREYDWLKHSWIAPGWQWVDPKKEADGKQVEIDTGLETISGTILSKGKDPRETLEERAKEQKFIQELEKKYNVVMFPQRQATPTNEVTVDDE